MQLCVSFFCNSRVNEESSHAALSLKKVLILPGSALNINGESCSPEVNEKLTP